MKACIIIPARWGSTRFPGKALAQIAGKSLIQRVWEIALAVKNANAAWVATDDKRIAGHCKDFGASVVLTSPNCKNGTERVQETLKRLKIRPQVVVNLQGDALITPPEIIEALIAKMLKDKNCVMATPAYRLSPKELRMLKKAKSNSKTSGTTVIFDKKGLALNFSRSKIISAYAHIGIYGYRPSALKKFVSLHESQLEKAEGLEQLRALENGIPIHAVVVNTKKRTLWAVDTPQDAKIAEEIIAREGELVS